MKYVQYLGPVDTFDVSNLLGKETVFHAPTNTAVPADQRGNVIQVTNDQYEQLMTYPNHRFVELPDDDAKKLVELQRKAQANREGLAARRAAASGQTLSAVAVDAQIAALTPPVEVAHAEPRKNLTSLAKNAPKANESVPAEEK